MQTRALTSAALFISFAFAPFVRAQSKRPIAIDEIARQVNS
jgi:hypothetical protein